MTHYNYPLPTASPYDDFLQYIPLLISAVQVELDRPEVWDDVDAAAAMAYMEELIAFLMLLDPTTGGDMKITTTIITNATTFPFFLKTLEAGETVDEVLIDVDDAFDVGSLEIGDSLQHDRLVSAANNSLFVAPEQFQFSPEYIYPTTTDVFAYFSGTPTTGSARIVLYTYTAAE